jgi:hypothetical protein
MQRRGWPLPNAETTERRKLEVRQRHFRVGVRSRPAQGGVLRRATETFRLADDVALKGQERLARKALTLSVRKRTELRYVAISTSTRASLESEEVAT